MMKARLFKTIADVACRWCLLSHEGEAMTYRNGRAMPNDPLLRLLHD